MKVSNKVLNIVKIISYMYLTVIFISIFSYSAIGSAIGKTNASATTGRTSKATLHANHVQYGKTKGSIIATGNVKITYETIEINADQIVWDKLNNIIKASGNVVFTKDNNIIKSNRIHMTADFKQAIMDAITAKLENNSYLTAEKTTRVEDENGKFLKFESPTYTLCRPNPKDATTCPIWRLRASSGYQDQKDDSYTFYNTRIEMLGIPVFYIPYLFVDGVINRETGFLTPSLGSTSSVGQYISLPFYWALTPDKDLTITPSKYLLSAQILTQAKYRQHLGNGRFSIEGSITQPTDYKKGGLNEDNPLRWHIQGDLKYNINSKWRMGAHMITVSDDTYLHVYQLNTSIYSDIFLPSNVYMERLDEHSYFLNSLTYYQDIRNAYSRTDTAYFLGQSQYTLKTDPDENDVYYTIDTGITAVKRTDKLSTYRAHISLDLDKSIVSSWGTRIDANLSLTGVGYHEQVEDQNYISMESKIDKLLLTPTASLKLSHPLVRPLGEKNDIVEILEPVVNFKLGFSQNLGDNNPNEDSQSQELDITNIFKNNRFSGIDRIENDTRVDYGFNWGFYFPDGKYIQSFVGESYRFNETSKYSEGSGLHTRRSDYVGSIEVVPSDYFSLSYQYRLDSKDLFFHRSEGSINVGPSFFRLGADYIKYDTVQEDPVTNKLYRQSSESLKGSVDIHLFDHWRSYTTAEFTISPTASYLLGTVLPPLTEYEDKLNKLTETISYDDECFDLSVGLTRTYYTDRDIKPETSVVIVLQLKSLGSINYNRVIDGGTDDTTDTDSNSSLLKSVI